MAQLIFDQGLATEVKLDVETIYERITENQLNCSKNYDLNKGEVIPDIPDIPTTFTTLKIMSGQSEIKTVKSYNKVKDFSTSYYDRDKVFSISIVLSYEV